MRSGTVDPRRSAARFRARLPFTGHQCPLADDLHTEERKTMRIVQSWHRTRPLFGYSKKCLDSFLELL